VKVQRTVSKTRKSAKTITAIESSGRQLLTTPCAGGAGAILISKLIAVDIWRCGKEVKDQEQEKESLR
jgi:hypothetical protein